jgi:WD40 repeat protein
MEQPLDIQKLTGSFSRTPFSKPCLTPSNPNLIVLPTVTMILDFRLLNSALRLRYAGILPYLILLCSSSSHAANEPSARSKRDSLTASAMSILRVNCLSCHNEEKKKGGLQLNSRENALKGSESGPVLVPRNADKSALIKVLLADSDPHMPPKKQLSEKDIARLRQWINGGAKWDTTALVESQLETKPLHFAPIPGSYHPVMALALSPDEKRLAVARANRIYIHDLSQTNYPVAAKLEGHRDTVQSVAWSRDGRWIATGSFRHIVLWDAPALRQERDITNNLLGRITALQFTSNSSTLVVSDGVPTKNGVIHLLSPTAETDESVWPAHKDSIYALCLSPDGKRIASAGADKIIRLWDTSTRKETGKLEAHTGHILALAFNPDGTMLASGAADKVLNFWETTNWHQAITLNSHPAPVTALAWAADGKNLISVCEDGIPRRFSEFKTHAGEQSGGGAQERAFEKARDILYCLAMTADGKTVFGGCHDGLVYVWNAEGKITATLVSPENETSGTTKRQISTR